MNLPFGVCGENPTTAGLFEATVKVCDRFHIGAAEFVVTPPRVPCFKCGIRFGGANIIKRFAKSGRNGFYCAVEKTGALQTTDEIEFLGGQSQSSNIAEIVKKQFNL